MRATSLAGTSGVPVSVVVKATGMTSVFLVTAVDLAAADDDELDAELDAELELELELDDDADAADDDESFSTSCSLSFLPNRKSLTPSTTPFLSATSTSQLTVPRVTSGRPCSGLRRM